MEYMGRDQPRNLNYGIWNITLTLTPQSTSTSPRNIIPPVFVGHSNRRKEKKGQILSYDGKDNQPRSIFAFLPQGVGCTDDLSFSLFLCTV